MFFIRTGTAENIWACSRTMTDRESLGLVSDWKGFLCSDDSEPANRLRQATRTGQPAGDGVFVETVERLTG
jgi:hypothetical protein